MQRIRTTSMKSQIRKAIVELVKDMPSDSDGKLPSEIDMANTLGVSRIALREVVKQLEQDGTLVSIHGKGTFANREVTKMKVRLTPAVEFEQAIRNSGYDASVSLESVSITTPPESVRKSLRLEPDEKVVRVRKTFYGDGHPAVFCEDMFSASLLGESSLVEKELEKSTFEYLLEKAGIIVVHDIAELLARTTDDLEGFPSAKQEALKPLLLIESVYYTAKHRPIMYVNAYMDTEYVKLSILRRQDVYED